MNIGEFIKLFDEKAIANGKVAFTFHAPKSGKWNFWSQPNEKNAKCKLAKEVMKIKELKMQDLDGFQETSLEPWGEDGIRIRITF